MASVLENSCLFTHLANYHSCGAIQYFWSNVNISHIFTLLLALVMSPEAPYLALKPLNAPLCSPPSH